MSGDEELTYGSYLRIPELLRLQQPRSRPPHPEELHFIIVHQAIELWMKLMLHDLERVIGYLDADAWPRALGLVGRVNQVMSHVLDQMRTLHTLPPWALEEFRSYLGSASGSQSQQFRELELLSGLRDPAYLKALEVEYGGELPAALAARRARRSLAEAHLEAGGRLGLSEPADWAELYVDAGGRGSGRSGFYLLCEALVDYDERWSRWRHEHVALVERALGDHARGTGGMALTYLRRTTRYRFFPLLWALRDELVLRGGGELVGRQGGTGATRRRDDERRPSSGRERSPD
ncbi:MAG TPA: tryptophan 2,3-dioxygenase family protein [Actinomycetes bacterium]|nr:tryptophan 2,3-dioxygenase family protein [Actinomycetes bacterium]